MNLALILVLRFLFLFSQSKPQVLRSISSAVKQRFPTLDHVVDTGFMTKNEKKLFEAVPANEFNTYWVPCTWFIFRFIVLGHVQMFNTFCLLRVQEAAKKGKLLNQYALESIMRVWTILLINPETSIFCLLGTF